MNNDNILSESGQNPTVTPLSQPQATLKLGSKMREIPLREEDRGPRKCPCGIVAPYAVGQDEVACPDCLAYTVEAGLGRVGSSVTVRVIREDD